jgi:hypothetical protein
MASDVAMYPVSGFLPENWIREPRFGPLFLDSVRMMVIPGLAGMRVQPCPRNKIELLAISSWLLAEPNLGFAKS